MPIYEYRCHACGHELERIQKVNDPLLTDCPLCGKAELVKLISPAAFRLKGTGWYETDFKKDGRRNVADDGNAKTSPDTANQSDSSGNQGSGDSSSSDTSTPSSTTS